MASSKTHVGQISGRFNNNCGVFGQIWESVQQSQTVDACQPLLVRFEANLGDVRQTLRHLGQPLRWAPQARGDRQDVGRLRPNVAQVLMSTKVGGKFDRIRAGFGNLFCRIRGGFEIIWAGPTCPRLCSTTFGSLLNTLREIAGIAFGCAPRLLVAPQRSLGNSWSVLKCNGAGFTFPKHSEQH